MFIVSSQHTMRGARAFVPDTGIDLRRKANVPAEARANPLGWAALRKARARAKRWEQARREVVESHPEAIRSMVCAWHGASVADVLSPRRSKPILAARNDVIRAIFENCRIDGRVYSLNEIGRHVNRDHTSVLHALQKAGLR